MERDAEVDNYYNFSSEQGLCLIGNVIINLAQVSVIHQTEGKTLVYYQGVREPLILPVGVFDELRDTVFADDEDDDTEDDDGDYDDDDNDDVLDGDSHIIIVQNDSDDE